jgi:hypothetical protein
MGYSIPYEWDGCPVISYFNLLLLMYVRIKYAVYLDSRLQEWCQDGQEIETPAL